MDRPNADGVVVIVPTVKKDGKDYVIFLISQRPPLGRKNIIEFPAGLIGDKDGGVEDVETAARRELLEETGLRVRRIIKMSVADSSVSSPGIATEKGSIVYVDCDLTAHASNLEADGEVIKKVVAVEKNHVKRWLEHKSYQGFTIDASVMAALYGMPEEEQAAQPFDSFVIYDVEKNIDDEAAPVH
ncbi:MAG TPA: NUDIX hydrolase [Oculatellaceae cyanobacterium]